MLWKRIRKSTATGRRTIGPTRGRRANVAHGFQPCRTWEWESESPATTPKTQLERLAHLARSLQRNEASVLREALDDVLKKYDDQLKGALRE